MKTLAPVAKAGTHRRRQPAGSRRLVLRIYLISIASIAIISLSFGVLKTTLLELPWKTAMEQRARYVVSHIADHRGDFQALGQEALRAQNDLGAEVTLYDTHGNLLVSNVTPPLPKLTAGEHGRLQLEGLFTCRTPGLVAVPVAEGGKIVAYGVIGLPNAQVPFANTAVLVGVVLLCLAMTSLLLARMLARPLEQLASAARAFGAGDLNARAGLVRRDEFGDVARAFDEMADRLTHLLRSQKELLANVSHELRTPMSRIQVALDLASEGDSNLARESLAEISEDLGELERLVEGIITSARLDLAAGRAGEPSPPLRLELVEPEAVLEKAAARFRLAWPAHVFELDVDGPLPPLRADNVLLRRAVDNLLDNAGKYSDPGSRVTLSARDAGDELVVEVIDRGIGLDDADRERLFTPFFRSDPSRARTTGGVGLGLLLARQIVQAHGGAIAVESKPGLGTTVRITVPIADEPEAG